MKAIIKGIKNFVFENKEVDKLAKRRALVCNFCEHKKKMKYEIIKDNRIKNISGDCCGLCKCPLSTLLRQNEKGCELGKW